jgi:hypothetical protein
MTQPLMFPESPVLSLYDPLGDLLGAGNGVFSYSFDDVAKMSGHACPTVAGGFLMVKRALEVLFKDERPQRGDIRVTVFGAQDEGTNGPMSQVFTLLTGAAADNGFHGLGGRFVRHGLLRFEAGAPGGAVSYRFERISNGEAVTLSYDASMIPPAATMGQDIGAILQGYGDEAVVERFRNAWRDRVQRILADQGQQTVREV